MFSSTASELAALSPPDKSCLFNGVSEKPEKASSGLAASNRKNLRRQFLSSTNSRITFPFIYRIWRTVTFLKSHPPILNRSAASSRRVASQIGDQKAAMKFWWPKLPHARMSYFYTCLGCARILQLQPLTFRVVRLDNGVL